MAKPEDLFEAVTRRLLPRPLKKDLRDRYRFHRADVVVVSFPKSGRTWLRAMLSHVFQEHYATGDFELLRSANLHHRDARIPRFFFTHDGSYKCRPEELHRDKSRYRRHKLVFLARDPRDIVISLYFHRTRRDRDLDLPLNKFVFGEAGGLRTILAFYNIWAKAMAEIPDKQLITYEALRSAPAERLGELLRFMDQNVNDAVIEHAVDETRFSRMQGREQGGDYARGFLRPGNHRDEESFKTRRGKVGGYVDYLTTDEVRRVDRMIAENLDPLFGYNEAVRGNSATG